MTVTAQPYRVSHHMVTRLKAGVFRPNPKYVMATTATGRPLSPVPKSVHAALADPN
jgi:hypothetical protein